MIITQTRQRRSFVGSLNAGDDILEAISQICVENAIFCAFFRGVGYLSAASLDRYNVQRRQLEPMADTPGTLHVVSLQGNVSLNGNQTVVRAHVTGTLSSQDGASTMLSAELRGGEVISFEFFLEAIDDIRLYRADDGRTGLHPWLHMELGQQGQFNARSHAIMPPSRGPSPNSPAKPDPDGATLTAADVGIGDLLEHPTLGRSEVVDDGDERVTIRLESGREVELHLGLLTLELIGRSDKGARLIKVSIRRRR